MTRRLVDLSLANLRDLPPRCQMCVFWELDPVSQRLTSDGGDPAFEKEAWVSTTLLEWGSCGKLGYIDGTPAGYAICAPPGRVPRSTAFPTSPVSKDAVLLTTLYVLPEYAGAGLGKALVHGVAKQVIRRPGVKAIEAFGDSRWDRPACLMPAGYLESIGFEPVRSHPRYPRMRLDLRAVVSWRAEVEVAIERLRGVVRPATVPSPVGSAGSAAYEATAQAGLRAGL